MLYLRPSFTLPVANPGTSDKNWDRAFLSKEDFEARWGKDSYNSAEYNTH